MTAVSFGLVLLRAQVPRRHRAGTGLIGAQRFVVDRTDVLIGVEPLIIRSLTLTSS